ncbi:hypothetical protein MKX41_10590 [Paenibacillus sp. FSL R5-0475]|uniref:hypothetical protein n=1 Tax=Paenibacillus sp. FSL R5-0475 TaxID=2921643 RepID=UPI0030F7F6E5
MQPIGGQIQYFKVEKNGELAGLFQSNSPDIIEAQKKQLFDLTVTEVQESEYKGLQMVASWNQREA